MIQIAGLWENETKNGAKYLQGNCGKVKYLIFANKYKEKDNHPDFNLFIAQNEYKKKE